MLDVVYFEDKDFDANTGKLTHNIDKTIVLLLFSNGCPHCVKMKPEYQKFATEHKNKGEAIVAAIQLDEPANSKIRNKMEKILGQNINFAGVPMILGMKNGKVVSEFPDDKGRTQQRFNEFIRNF